MADTSVAIQPAPSGAPAAPVQLKLFTAPDPASGTVLIQGVCLVNENGVPVSLMTQAQAQDLILAITNLAAAVAKNSGDFIPT